jgi:hypothetical protein
VVGKWQGEERSRDNRLEQKDIDERGQRQQARSVPGKPERH